MYWEVAETLAKIHQYHGRMSWLSKKEWEELDVLYGHLAKLRRECMHVIVQVTTFSSVNRACTRCGFTLSD